MATKTEKLLFKSYTHSKWSYVGKVPKLVFENLTQNMINFEAFLVEKVPKSSVFNRNCMENRKIWNRKNYENQKRVKIKNRVFEDSRKLCSGQIKLCLRHGFCKK